MGKSRNNKSRIRRTWLSAGFEDSCALVIFGNMKLESLHVGMRVRHPQYGLGTVKTISETTAEVQFNDGKRAVAPDASGLEPGEPQAAITGLDLPLSQLIQQTVAAAIDGLGLEKPDAVVEQLGTRWHRGKIVLHPSDPTLQTKEVPLEVLFHKVVGIRNQLRVLEQKINAHPTLTDADKVEMQQYVTRCYGSLTTFNLLFRNKEDQFSTKSE
jgi:hypothetical protein